jgi:hypothetical protein
LGAVKIKLPEIFCKEVAKSIDTGKSMQQFAAGVEVESPQRL